MTVWDQGFHLPLYLVSRFPVSVWGRGWARTWFVPVGPAGLLAPGLLLGPTLDTIVSMLGVTLLVVWSEQISEDKQQCNHSCSCSQV